MSYKSWPLGQLPPEFQRPELKQLKKAGYKFSDPREVVTMFENKVAELLAAKQQEVGRNRLTLTEMNEVKTALRTWSEDSGLYVGPTKQGDGQDGADKNFEFTGDPDTIANEFLKAIEGADEDTKAAAWAAASAAALKYFNEKETPSQAAKSFEEWQKRTMKGVTGGTNQSSYHQKIYGNVEG